MINFDELRNKATNFAKTAADKSKVTARIAKLSIENTVENDKIKKKYTEIGKLYFEKYKEIYDPDFEDLFAEINQSLEKIAATDEEIAKLKADGKGNEEPEAEDEAEAVTVEAEVVSVEEEEASEAEEETE